MPETSLKGVIPKEFTPITDRDLSNLEADKAAVAALGQGVLMWKISLFHSTCVQCRLFKGHTKLAIHWQKGAYGRVCLQHLHLLELC